MSDDSCMCYEKSKKVYGIFLTYETRVILDEESEHDEFSDYKKMEHLYLGDVVKYHDPIKGYDPFNKKVGIVTNIDRKECTVVLSTGDIFPRWQYFTRIIVYHPEINAIKTQNGTERHMDGFDLRNIGANI